MLYSTVTNPSALKLCDDPVPDETLFALWERRACSGPNETEVFSLQEDCACTDAVCTLQGGCIRP